MGNPCPMLSHIFSIMGILDLGEFLEGISRNLRSLGSGTGGPTLWGLASFPDWCVLVKHHYFCDFMGRRDHLLQHSAT